MLYRIVIPMRYADMDSNQHINNVSSFRYFEEARVQWSHTLGIAIDGSGQGPVVVDTGAEFLTEMVYPGKVVVTAEVKHIGNSSYSLLQQIAREDQPDKIITRGHCTMVWVDHQRKKSTPLPAALRAALEAASQPA